MYHKILVPLDGSKRAEKILPHVEELARRYKAKIIFLQVVEYKTIATTEGAFINYSDTEFEQTKKQAETHLEGIQGEFRGKQHHKPNPRHLWPGGGRDNKHRCTRGRGFDRAGQSRPRGSFQSFLRQCCRRTIASCGPPPVDHKVAENGIIAFFRVF